MNEDLLVKLFEHNNWANRQIVQACANLSEAQLDAEPQSATMGSIRKTLLHLASAQVGYLLLLTQPVEARSTTRPAFTEVPQSVESTGEAFLRLVRDLTSRPLPPRLQTRDEYFVEPWVIMLQIINHATEHREQIKSMLSALGVTPPDIDGWSYGEATHALVPMRK